MALFVADINSPITSALANIELIKDSNVYVTSRGEVIVALLTQPIFMASERDKLQDLVKSTLMELGYTGDIYISFDTDIYLELAKINNDNLANDIIEKIVNRK